MALLDMPYGPLPMHPDISALDEYDVVDGSTLKVWQAGYRHGMCRSLSCHEGRRMLVAITCLLTHDSQEEA